MWLDDDDWYKLHILATERLQNARLELIMSEAAIKEIEDHLVRIILKDKGITWVNVGQVVLVDFSDNPNSPCIYEGHSGGMVKLRHLSKRGRPHKTVYTYNLAIAHRMRLALDNSWKSK